MHLSFAGGSLVCSRCAAQAAVVAPQTQILRVMLWGLFDHCWQNGTVGALLGSSALSQPLEPSQALPGG